MHPTNSEVIGFNTESFFFLKLRNKNENKLVHCWALITSVKLYKNMFLLIYEKIETQTEFFNLVWESSLEEGKF